MDESLPAGNSFAVDSLLELGYVEGNKKYIDAAEKAILSSSDSLHKSGISHASFLLATMNLIEPKKIIISDVQKIKLKIIEKNCSH